MKRAWKKRRCLVQQQDAAHRWDQVYQLLLRWNSSTELEEFALIPEQKELKDENSNICACVNPETSSVAND